MHTPHMNNKLNYNIRMGQFVAQTNIAMISILMVAMGVCLDSTHLHMFLPIFEIERPWRDREKSRKMCAQTNKTSVDNVFTNTCNNE